MNILVLNCGSSSAKFAVIDANTGQEFISGLAQRLGSPQATLDWKSQAGKNSTALAGASHDTALRAVVDLLRDLRLMEDLKGIGHRVVHGGSRFSGPVTITPAVEEMIGECIQLGPLHNPPNLLGIHIAKELLPKLPQVAVFDTAFHQTKPKRAYTYPVPYAWLEQHQVRRYGFHGTSHRFVSQEAIRELGLSPGDNAVITAHLGNGCSCAAVRNGKSVDTTMGLTPLEGLVMGTRSGSVDPAIIGYMARALHEPPEKILDALNKQSGLLGLSGISNDMRVIAEAAARGHERAALALEIFCYVLAKAVASLVVPLGRLDALVFTGGIGENSVPVRARVVDQLGFLGLAIDASANADHGRTRGGRISSGGGPVVVVVPTNEELMIAAETAEVVEAARVAGPPAGR